MNTVHVSSTNNTIQERQTNPILLTNQRPADTATNFILGDRMQETRTGSTNSEHHQNELSRNMPQTRQDTSNDSNIELLKHLANDFAGLLNRVDISDCALRVRGK
jgi:hypothetical protein